MKQLEERVVEALERIALALEKANETEYCNQTVTTQGRASLMEAYQEGIDHLLGKDRP